MGIYVTVQESTNNLFKLILNSSTKISLENKGPMSTSLRMDTQFLFEELIKSCGLLLFILLCNNAYAQQKPVNAYPLGSVEAFARSYTSANKANRQGLSINISEDQQLTVKITVDNSAENHYDIIGTLPEFKNATIYFNGNKSEVKGKVIIFDTKEAYDIYTTDEGEVLIEPIDIHKVVCIDYPQYEAGDERMSSPGESRTSAIPELENFPSAPNVIYLDFDGEVVSGTRWNGGNTINAQPSGFTNTQITQIWKIIAEDFAPFNVNITTTRSIYDSADPKSRLMVIFTPTNDASPGAGGVAMLGSFTNDRDDPCWVFNPGVYSAAVAGSHEAGHTLGLRHDGTSSNGYSAGQGNWGPIMGAPYSKPLVQWCKGEYDDANNQEDDLAIISGIENNIGYRTDDHGNDRANPTIIVSDQFGKVSAENNQGIIEQNTDKDLFEFSTSGGAVEFTVNGANDFNAHGNLDIQLRLLNMDGQELKRSSPGEELSASVTANVSPGTYYLEIDGTGNGNPGTDGYSDYGSLGFYDISGSFPPGSNTAPPIVEFESELNCNKAQFKNLTINTANEILWDFGDGHSSTEKNPVHIYERSGTYTVSLAAANDYGSDIETKKSLVTVNILEPPVTQGDSECNGGQVTLSASGGDGTEYHWYDAPTDGNLLHKGNTYSPTISNTTSYYVESIDATPVQNVGATDNSIGNGAYFSANDVRGLFFDVHTTVLLESVKVYSDKDEVRIIEVLDEENGDVVASKEVYIPTGESRVDLGFVLEKHTGYFMKVTGSVNLFRNAEGANYPYEIANLVSVTQSNAGSSALSYFYYFYDWEVQGYGCSSKRVPVVADVVCTDVTEVKETPINLYPNPVQSLLTIEGLDKIQAADIEIINSMGQIVKKLDNPGNRDKLFIKMQSMPKGLYFVRVLTSGKTIVKKIIVGT